MGIFDPIKRDDNIDPFLDSLISFSSDSPGAYVSVGTLRNSDIYAAVSIIAGDLASNPVKCDSPLYTKLLNDQPNNVMDGYHFKYALAVEMLLNGNSFARIDEGKHSLTFIPNNQMTVEQDETTQALSYTYSPDGKRNYHLKPENVLHFKYLTRNGVTGISPLYSLRDEQKIQKTANNLLSSFFTQGIHGTTILSINRSDLDPEARENMRRKFEEENNGENALRTIVTDSNIDVKNLPLNTDVLKLVNSNDWTTRQIAKAFGLPPERLGVENQHSNQQQSNVQYLQGTLQHYEDCIISELNYKLGQVFQYDNGRLLSLDPIKQQELAVDGYTNGLYTRNEARKLLNLDPVPGGDEFMMNGGSNSGQKINADS